MLNAPDLEKKISNFHKRDLKSLKSYANDIIDNSKLPAEKESGERALSIIVDYTDSITKILNYYPDVVSSINENEETKETEET